MSSNSSPRRDICVMSTRTEDALPHGPSIPLENDDDCANQRDRRCAAERGTNDLFDRVLRGDGAARGRLRGFPCPKLRAPPIQPNRRRRTTEEEVQLTAEERIKNEEHPLDSYYRLLENAQKQQGARQGGNVSIQMERSLLPLPC